MIRTTSWSAAVLGLLIAATANDAFAQIYTGSQPITVPLIARTQAERVGLTRGWVTQLPLDPARSKVRSIRSYSGLILAVTDEGMLHVVDAETGVLQWSFEAGDRHTLTLAAGANANRVAVANTAFLYVLDRKTGDLILQKRLTGTPERGPVLTANHVVLPLVRGPVEVYTLDSDTGSNEYPTYLPGAGRVIGHPAVTEVGVAWAGDLNRVHGHQFSEQGTDFSAAVGDGISTGPAIYAPYIFLGTESGFLIAYDVRNGDEAWRFSTGSPIRELPMPLGDAVYVLPEDGGMFALSMKTGDRLWYSPDPRKFVSASPKHVYTLDQFGRLAILDAKTGARAGALAIPRSLIPLPNDQSDRLVFYTERGLLQSLHETQLAAPHMYIQPKAAAPKSPAAAPAEVTPPAGLPDAAVPVPADPVPVVPPAADAAPAPVPAPMPEAENPF